MKFRWMQCFIIVGCLWRCQYWVTIVYDVDILNGDRVMNCRKFCCWNHISDFWMWLMFLDGYESQARFETRGEEYSCEKNLSFGAFENWIFDKIMCLLGYKKNEVLEMCWNEFCTQKFMENCFCTGCNRLQYWCNWLHSVEQLL